MCATNRQKRLLRSSDRTCRDACEDDKHEDVVVHSWYDISYQTQYMKVRIKELTKEQRIQTLDALYTAAASMKGRDAVKLFLRDLLTESERIMLGRRILIAKMLLEGDTFADIIDELGVGKDTVNRVEHWLQDQMPGYEQAIKGLHNELEYRRGKRNKAFTPYSLKMKHPFLSALVPWGRIKQ